MEQRTLFEQFRIEGRNTETGKSIVYALTYPQDRLVGHQSKIIRAIQRRGITLKDCGDRIEAYSSLSKTEKENKRIAQLFSRLACINESMDYLFLGFGDFKGINGLSSHLIASYLSKFNDRNLVEAYDFLETVLTPVAQSLERFAMRNNLLTDTDRRAIHDLNKFSKRHLYVLNRPGQYVLFG